MTFDGKKITAGIALALATYGLGQTSGWAAKLNPTSFVVDQAGITVPLAPPSGVRVGSFVSGQITFSGNVAPNPPPIWGNLFDNNPGTFVTITNFASMTNVPGLLIDLGQTNAIDRVAINGSNPGLHLYLNCGLGTQFPLGLIVAYAGNSPQSMTNVGEFVIPYDAGNPVDTSMDIRFSPVPARYLRLDLQTRVTWGVRHWPGYAISSQPTLVDTAWNIGEVEVYGASGPSALVKSNAVVLEANAPSPLALAASDLSYYLSELTGLPHPIITPAQTNGYTGTLYYISDLASLATTYTQMTNNIAAGLLPYGVNVYRTNGNAVVFSAWPYRCVLWSVWEFLERQGIHWVYPDIHGDFVPTGAGVNLGVLPLRFLPTANSIYANWGASEFEPWPAYQLQSLHQEYLYVWRNRWNSTCGANTGPLGGNEIPRQPATGLTLNSNYTEAFTGYPHNFNNAVPDRILVTQTNWWGWANPTTTQTAFAMCQPSLINWLAAKVTNVAQVQPLATYAPLNNLHYLNALNLLPMDGTLFSQDSNSLTANALYGPTNINTAPYVLAYGGSGFSGAYYTMISQVANQVKNVPGAMVGGLAYSDVYLPPNFTLPTNVQVEVCMYGSPNIPMTAPFNADVKAALDGWTNRCSHLAIYDYALLFTDFYQTNGLLPVPLVAGIVDHAKYLAAAGALNGGTQATESSIQYNPWDFYAYPRIRWNTNQTAAQIEGEFFQGYYQEAAAPMLAYYQSLENYQFSNNVNMHYTGYCYWMNPGTFPLAVLNQMYTNLQTARLLATNWYVSNRVQDSVTAFNWVLAQSGITDLTMLTNYSGFATVPGSGTYQVDLSGLTKSPVPTGFYNPAYISGGVWNFGGGCSIQETFNFVKAGTYRVDVTANCPYSAGSWPLMNVYLAGGSGNVMIKQVGAPATYSFYMTVPIAGPWPLIVNNSTSAGFLNIEGIQIVPQ
jgi:hypothetical protein